MAIIYTFPTKATPAGNDLILISDSADSNKTKQIKVSSLPSSGAGITLTTTGTSGVATLTGSVLNIPNYATGGTPSLPLNGVQYRDNNGNFAAASSLIFESNNGKLIVGDAANDIYGAIEIQSDNNVGAELKIQGGGGFYTTIRGAQIDTASYNITLPVAGPGGNDKILQSDSSGNLSWITTPSGSSSTLGFSPLSIYQAQDNTSTGNLTTFTMTVCDIDFSPYAAKVAVRQGTGAIYVAIYSLAGDVITSTPTLLGSFSKTADIAVGVNTLDRDTSSFSLTAGQNIMIAVSTNNGIIGSNSNTNTPFLYLQKTDLNTTWPSNPLGGSEVLGTFHPAIHFYGL